MGVTLHAIVEVQIEGDPKWSRWPRYWTDVATWELNKNSELSMALDEVTCRDWPAENPSDPLADPEVSSERRRVDEEDIGSNRRWGTLDRLRHISDPEPGRDWAFRGRFKAILAACEVLALEYGGAERVRVLFYSIT